MSGALSCGCVGRLNPGVFSVMRSIQSGSPETILSTVSQMLDLAKRLGGVRGQLRTSARDLALVWPHGVKSGDTQHKLAQLDQVFGNVISLVGRVSEVLKTAARTIQRTRQAFAAGIAQGDARIIPLLAAAAAGKPGAYAKAKATAAQTTGSLQGIIGGFGQLLKSLGLTQLGEVLSQVGELAGQLEQLFSKNSGQAGSGEVANGGTYPSGSGAGQSGAWQGAGQGVGQSGAWQGSGGQSWQQNPLARDAWQQGIPPEYTDYRAPALSPGGNDLSWIPVDRPGQVEVAVTTKDGMSTTVRAVAGQDAAFDVKLGSEQVRVTIDGDGDGKVTPR